MKMGLIAIVFGVLAGAGWAVLGFMLRCEERQHSLIKDCNASADEALEIANRFAEDARPSFGLNPGSSPATIGSFRNAAAQAAWSNVAMAWREAAIRPEERSLWDKAVDLQVEAETKYGQAPRRES